MFSKIKKSAVQATVMVSTFALANSANAAGADFSALTNGVDFGSATTAVITIAAAIASVYVAIAGARAVLRMIKGS